MKHGWIQQTFMIVLGNFIVAFAASFLILPNDLLTGGVTGVAVALEPLIHVEPVYMVNFLTVGLFLLGLIFLGKSFALKAFLSTLVYPTFINILTFVVNQVGVDAFIMPDYLASIYSGILVGFGLGLVFRMDGSTGGMDIPALIINKYTPISSGHSVIIVDACTVLLGIMTHGLEPALVGIMSVYVSGIVINKVMVLGSQSAKNVMIISNYHEQIRELLLNKVDRGVTILNAKGGYTEQDRPVLMCIISAHQYPMLEQSLKEVDPAAFIVVSDVNEIHGSGFTFADGTLNRHSW